LFDSKLPPGAGAGYQVPSLQRENPSGGMLYRKPVYMTLASDVGANCRTLDGFLQTAAAQFII